MYLSKLDIEGYKNFGTKACIEFHEGLNVLIGENGVGKTAIIDALRLLFPEDDYRSPISDSDFYRPFSQIKEEGAKSFRIHGKFEGLSKTEIVAFLPWTNIEGNATLTLQVDNKTNNKGRYKPLLWGGASRSSMFETELFDAIDCIYLPPLRDAEAKLREGKSSRLAKLLKNLNKQSIKEAREKNKPHSLEKRVKEFNDELAKDDKESISKASDLIKNSLRDAIGDVFGQDTKIQFSETSFNRIVECLRLFFFPEIGADVPADAFRSLEENSLGYNNLLYIATVLAELTFVDNIGFYKVLLIEEPEAHLHPQLQVRLLKYLEKTAQENNVQVIVTTHSPVLAASASIDSLIHLSRFKSDDEYTYVAVALESCGLTPGSKDFVRRWLDVTKSTLLFARGVILVEGIAEAMLLPELARIVLTEFNDNLKEKVKAELSSFNLENRYIELIRYRNFQVKVGNFDSDGEAIVAVLKEKYIDAGKSFLPISFEDAGISIINMNGIYFEHFIPLFCNLNGIAGNNIPVLCSGITDNDPPKYADDKKTILSKPTPSNLLKGKNPALGLIDTINSSDFARLYANPLKTFEYDLAMESHNRDIMLDILLKLWPSKTEEAGVKKELKDLKEKVIESDHDKAEVAFEILKRIDDSNIGKGLFAQVLADKLRPIKNQDGMLEYPVEFAVPNYIKKAVVWACGGTPDDA